MNNLDNNNYKESILMEKEILMKLQINPITPKSFEILIAALKSLSHYSKNNDLSSLKDWNAPIISRLKYLEPQEIEFIESKFPESNISIEECQLRVQKLIPQEERKEFAAYYTIADGANFMASTVAKYIEKYKKSKIVIVDPFIGSGMALTRTLQKIGASKVKKIWGIEPLSLPALVAYTAAVKALDGKKELVEIVNGDAFKVISENFSPFVKSKLPKPDVILTNPPFTRWKYLKKDYRDYLLKLINDLGYNQYITRKEVSLQTLCMFLSDYILEDKGLIMSVLPASTFYTIYGKGYKSFLKSNYDTLGLIENSSASSFSEDSGFKEIILTAIKEMQDEYLTAFTELNSDAEEMANFLINKSKTELTTKYSADLFNIHKLPRFLDINWASLFKNKELRNLLVELFTEGLEKGTLEYWDKALGNKSIIRGVEMYGPDFFFIPNKYWKIDSNKENFIEIKNEEGLKLDLNKEFLIKTFRKPSLYDKVIESDIESHMITIPPINADQLSTDMQTYIKWGLKSNTASPAVNSYGELWYSHVYKQMTTKKPFGHIFIPDKVDLGFKRRGLFANYSKEKMAASKNFYIVKDKSEEVTKTLAGWFNSTIFISTFVLLGRKISDTWTRLLRNDYLEIPLINAEKIDKKSTLEICENVDQILKMKLPPLWQQLDEDYRFNLDLSLIKSLGVKDPEQKVEKLYEVLNGKFNT